MYKPHLSKPFTHHLSLQLPSRRGYVAYPIGKQPKSQWFISNFVPTSWVKLRWLNPVLKPMFLNKKELLEKEWNLKREQGVEVEQSVLSVKENGLLVSLKTKLQEKEGKELELEVKELKGLLDSLSLGWFGFKVKLDEVQGHPFVEDLVDIKPNRCIQVEFYGEPLTKVTQMQQLYETFRQYGRIHSIKIPPKDPKLNTQLGTIVYYQTLDAIRAKVCRNESYINNTKVCIGYRKPMVVYELVKWVTSHPRITLPLTLALLVTLIYLIFDPIRKFNIKNHLTQTYSFDLKQWVQLLNSTVLEKLGRKAPLEKSALTLDLKEASDQLLQILDWEPNRYPKKVAVLVGPKGSGKSQLLDLVLEGRKLVVVLDGAKLSNEDGSVNFIYLANTLGYYPIFDSVHQLVKLSEKLTTLVTGILNPREEDNLENILNVFSQALVELDSELKPNSGEKRCPTVVLTNLDKCKVQSDRLVQFLVQLVEKKLANLILVSESKVEVQNQFKKANLNPPVTYITLQDASYSTSYHYLNRHLPQLHPNDIEAVIQCLGGRLTDLNRFIHLSNQGHPTPLALDLLMEEVIQEILTKYLDLERNRLSLEELVQRVHLLELLVSSEEVPYNRLTQQLPLESLGLSLHQVAQLEATGILLVETKSAFDLHLHLRIARPAYSTAIHQLLSDTSFRQGIQTLQRQAKLQELREQRSVLLARLTQWNSVSLIDHQPKGWVWEWGWTWGRHPGREVAKLRNQLLQELVQVESKLDRLEKGNYS